METQLQNQAKTPLPSSVSPVQTGLFQQRPFTEPEQEAAETLPSSQQPPNLQTQIDTAARLGHNFSKVQVNTPTVIQPQRVSKEPEDQQDERESDGMIEPVKLIAPPLGKPIQREPEEDEPIQLMPQLGFLTPVIQRQVEEDEPIQMMPQLGLVQRQELKVDEEPIQMMPQLGLVQRQEAEDDDEPQMPQIQLKVIVGQPGDKYEQEADNIAAQVMSMSAPPANSVPIGHKEEEEEPEPLLQKSSLADSITPLVQRLPEEQEEPIPTKLLLQRAAKGDAEAGSNVESQLNNSKGGGSPLPDEVRSFMEPRFGVDFSSVRVHTGSSAIQMNKDLRAQAFTHGSDIYYGAGKSAAQDALTAHELTHVVQQTGGVRLKKELQRQVKAEEEQELLQAKELLGTQEGVSLNKTVQPAETFVEKTLPGYTSQLSLNKEVRLKAEATAEETQAQPIQAKQYTSLNVSSITPRIQGDFLGIPTSVEEAKRKILSPVAQLASRLPGYPLLTVILGKDPINEAPVERNATNLIRGVLSLVPKGQEFFDNLQKSGAIDKAYHWFNEQIAKLNLTWEAIKGLFKRAWDSLGAGDILNPGGAFEKIKNVFLEPIGRIKSFAVNAGTKVMEFVFEGVMGGGAKVMEIIRRAGGVFNTIISDPIKFIGNLVGALKGGFQQFSGNILNHLKNGLVGWLFGALAGAGLMLPAQFDLKGIVSLVLQVLGLTYHRLRGLLVKMIGEPKVAKLEKVFDFLMMIVTQGLGAAWQKITEFAGGLQEMVMGGIREWVQNSIITAAITKLLSMFNPAGAVIQAVMAIYNTIMFFIERGPQIAAVAEAVFASIGSIAGGNIAAAANYVEQTMGRTLPVVISFLARLIGLGGISEHIKNVIKKIQSPIENAMTKVANFIVQKGKSLLGRDKKGKDNKEGKNGKLKDTEVGKTINFSAKGESHRLWIDAKATSVKVMVASAAEPVETKLNNWQGRLNSLPEDKRQEAKSLLGIARDRLGVTEQNAQKTKQEMEEVKQNSTNEAVVAEAEQADNQTEAAEQSLATIIERLFELFGEKNTLEADSLPSRAAIAEAEKRLSDELKWTQDSIYKAQETLISQPTDKRRPWTDYINALQAHKRKLEGLPSPKPLVTRWDETQSTVQKDPELAELAKEEFEQIKAEAEELNRSILSLTKERPNKPSEHQQIDESSKGAIPTLEELQDVQAREAIRLRGGGKGQVDQLGAYEGQNYADLTVKDLQTLERAGNDRQKDLARTALKIIKQADAKRQKYGNS